MPVRHTTILIALFAVLILADACLAGVGKPLPRKTDDKQLKSSEAYARALEKLQEKGYSKEQADAALAKLGPKRLSLLEQDLSQIKGGGFLDLLLFILLVALIVWLILVLIEADRGYYYRRRY